MTREVVLSPKRQRYWEGVSKHTHTQKLVSQNAFQGSPGVLELANHCPKTFRSWVSKELTFYSPSCWQNDSQTLAMGSAKHSLSLLLKSSQWLTMALLPCLLVIPSHGCADQSGSGQARSAPQKECLRPNPGEGANIETINLSICLCLSQV